MNILVPFGFFGYLVMGAAALAIWLSPKSLRLLSAWCEARAAGLDALRAQHAAVEREARVRLGVAGASEGVVGGL